MDFTVTSDRLNISGNVENFDKISLNIDSKRLYLYKIIPLPLELEHKYLMFDLNFNAQLSKKYLELRGYIYSNKRFRAYLNLLKPALARGELKCIGATTYSEFRNHLDKDKALSRRFSKIDIEEPSIENTKMILDGVKDKYEEYHEIYFLDEAIESAIELSVKYLHDRYLTRIRLWISLMRVGANFNVEG